MIRAAGLDVRFGRGEGAVHAVRAVDFEVAPAGSIGLVGESGSGKSTVLRAIAGLVDDWTGTLEIAGEPLGRSRSRQFRREVQMVFQDPYGALHPRHAVDRILKEPLVIQGFDARDRRVEAALDEVGLDASFRYRFPHQLSGGQRQRVAIARALIIEPRVLLLDEPTSALDVSIQAEVLNLLQRLRRERALTYVLVSHNLAVVGHMCEHLVVMRDGDVVESMDVATLRRRSPTHPYTRQLFQASLGYDAAVIASFVDDL